MYIHEVADLEHYTDEELLSLLKDVWGIEENEEIEVIGELSCHETEAGAPHCRIHNVMLLKNKSSLEYPINNLASNNKIANNGIYAKRIPNKILKQLKNSDRIAVTCTLQLSNSEERIKHENPFLLVANSLQILTNIDESFIIKNSDGSISVTKSILGSIQFEHKQEIADYKQSLKDEIDQINKEKESKKEELARLGESTQESELVIKSLADEIQKKQNNQELLIQKLEELEIQIENAEKVMATKLEKLNEFIKEKADKLIELEFIEQDDYNKLFMHISDATNDNELFLSFADDLDKDKQKAISHIQAYLFKQDIIYPRYILENFFALVQTNDLIILAGESGSGKTNLIKSFADAIGGKSFVIPVKPNWTSSEDLLGYYNPLEKKYLTTPFLEALIEAKNNPTVPYFICLDEMNLARVEYYFADFLSLLEERIEEPEIKLYSDDETAHVLSEFKNVMDLIKATKEKFQKKNIVNFVHLLQDKEINQELTRVFGFSDKDSLIKYHTDLRRMINGIINTPSSILFPKNVRIIGAINIDETTHYLSPKILDRAHIMKFESPLLSDWIAIEEEIEKSENDNLRIKISIEELGMRKPYPPFDNNDEFCQTIVDLTKKYFSPLGIEVGLRTIRQGLNYQTIFTEQSSDKNLIINNFIIHKILPKLTFDGSKKVIINGDEKEKITLLNEFINELKKYIVIDEDTIEYKANNAIHELEEIVRTSRNNNNIVNYWA